MMSNKSIDEATKIFFFCGNARTFLKCFDSAYDKLISKLYNNNLKSNTHVLFYLKCDDPGPKGQTGWNFTYPPFDEEMLKNEISKFMNKYKNITFHSKILKTNEISDIELLSQVKCREKYQKFFSCDKKLLRGLHCHYNIYRCNEIIEEIEEKHNLKFDHFIYVRPDLYFLTNCSHISQFNLNKIITGHFRQTWKTDHIAIIPRKYKYDFFSARMDLIRTNTEIIIRGFEHLYFLPIQDICEEKVLGRYKILRK